MFGQSMLSLPVAAGFASVAVAQLSGWQAGEVNATMCTWMGLRVAVVRDTVYMDGGSVEWRPGLSDGSYGEPIQDSDAPGIVYTLNFSTPFNPSQNMSALFQRQSKGSAAPLYYDGALLANDDEYFLFGGMPVRSQLTADPPDNQGLEYLGYVYGVDKPGLAIGFSTYQLTGNITRYITYGGAANVPSENLAFYFSGLRGSTWGEIYYPENDTGATASVVSDTLITLDMSTQQEEKWSNATLPDGISGRASPELVWVPVGEQGILVALGGVVYPEFVDIAHFSDNETASEEQSPIFMSDIDIYDIAGKTWYTQSTSGGPGAALAQGCAVMQPAKDYSSFNIYWYGGYDGIHPTNSSHWSDAVWVLSLPSFTWKQVASGPAGPRAGHKCIMPYPDQMMVIGGTPPGQASGYSCVEDIIRIFNVSSAQWLDRYDPTVWYEYEVPRVIYEAIGGNESGGATSTAPGSWDTSALGDIFQVAYATSKITTWYPYHEATTTGSTTNPTYTAKPKSSSGVPKYLAPVLGVILGLVFVSSLVVGMLLWRRRRLLKKNGGVSVVATDENGNRILSWINGQRTETKAETITSTDEAARAMSPTPDPAGFHQAEHYPFLQQYGVRNQQPHQGPIHHEVANNELFELPEDTRAAELSDTPMSPSDIVQRRFSSASPQGTRSMGWSSIQATEQGSMVSSTSFARNAPPAPPSSESHATSSVAGGGGQPPTKQRSQVRPDSTALPIPLARSYNAQELPASPSPPPPAAPSSSSRVDPTTTTTNPRGESGVSAFSERERAHLRNLSDPATVSTMDGGSTAAPHSQTHGGRVASPPILEEDSAAAADEDHRPPAVVSPPTEGDAEGEDYLSVSPVPGREPPARAARRSAFRESDEDLGGRQ